MDRQIDDETRKILEQKALDLLEDMTEKPDDILSFQAGFVGGWIMRDENQAIYEPLKPPTIPVGAYICATGKHLSEEDWTVLSKYFYLMVPMSEQQRCAVAKVAHSSGDFSIHSPGVPVVYYPFGEVSTFTPSKQSGGNFVNPELEIETTPREKFECVEGDGYDDLKTGKKLRWHDVSTQVGKKMMQPIS